MAYVSFPYSSFSQDVVIVPMTNKSEIIRGFAKQIEKPTIITVGLFFKDDTDYLVWQSFYHNDINQGRDVFLMALPVFGNTNADKNDPKHAVQRIDVREATREGKFWRENLTLRLIEVLPNGSTLEFILDDTAHQVIDDNGNYLFTI